MQCRLRAAVVLAVAVCAAGCDRREFVPVEGRVTTLDGKPLPEVQVKFLPDSLKGNMGNTASATTDSDGRYLLTSPRDKKDGTVTGPHRVILIDLPAQPMYGTVPPPAPAPGVESPPFVPTGPKPRRFPLKYEEPLGTPLVDVDVNAARRTFDFAIEAEKSRKEKEKPPS